MNYMEIKLNDIAQEQGSFRWLTVLLIKRLGYILSKLDFWNAVCSKYGLLLKKLPSYCGCKKPCDLQHTISC